MSYYLIYFNQSWVGDHTEEWFASRSPLVGAVIEEMKTAGVFVFAGGTEEELRPLYVASPAGAEALVTDGPFTETKEYVGGFALIDAPDDDAARGWADQVAEACGWPHAVRRFK